MLVILTWMEIPFFIVVVKVIAVNLVAFSYSIFMWDYALPLIT